MRCVGLLGDEKGGFDLPPKYKSRILAASVTVFKNCLIRKPSPAKNSPRIFVLQKTFQNDTLYLKLAMLICTEFNMTSSSWQFDWALGAYFLLVGEHLRKSNSQNF